MPPSTQQQPVGHCLHIGCEQVFSDRSSLRSHLLSDAPGLLAECTFLRASTLQLSEALSELLPLLSEDQQRVVRAKLQPSSSEYSLLDHLASVHSTAELISLPDCQACSSCTPLSSQQASIDQIIPSRQQSISLEHTCAAAASCSTDGSDCWLLHFLDDDSLPLSFAGSRSPIEGAVVELIDTKQEDEFKLSRFDISCGWPDDFGSSRSYSDSR
jgi:hypothetical protein